MEYKNEMNDNVGMELSQEPVAQPVVQPSVMPVAPAEKPKAKKNLGMLISLIGGMVSGLVSLFFGIMMYSMPTGYWESSERYGGDAYTGIQNAAAQTANNVQDLAQIAQQGFAFVLMAAGLITVFVFASKLFKKETN